eukprot:scaffold78009_cov20-Tisochrysis_lutea.AAC.1
MLHPLARVKAEVRKGMLEAEVREGNRGAIVILFMHATALGGLLAVPFILLCLMLRGDSTYPPTGLPTAVPQPKLPASGAHAGHMDLTGWLSQKFS